jgi:hypothetical protein
MSKLAYQDFSNIPSEDIDKINVTLEKFEEAVRHFLTRPNNGMQRAKVSELLKWSYKSFTRDCLLFIDYSCPGSEPCSDGSCPPC